MGRLFGRRARLTVGSLKVESEGEKALKITFSIHKSTRLAENSAKIEVYNLSEQTRQRLTDESENTLGVIRHIVLEAGYADQIRQIFAGDRAWVGHALKGTDWVTTVESLDGNALLRQQVPPKTFDPKVDGFTIFGDLADTVKANWDNIKKSPDIVDALKRTIYDAGKTVDGSLRKAIGGIASDAGLDLSVQDGELCLTVPGGLAIDSGVRLSETSGLVGIPEKIQNPSLKQKPGKKRSSKQKAGASAILIKGRCLLQGDILPTRKFALDSVLTRKAVIAKGTGSDAILRALTVDHVGDTHGGDESWLTTWTAEQLIG